MQTDEGQINRNKDRSLGKQTYRYTDTQKKTYTLLHRHTAVQIYRLTD